LAASVYLAQEIGALLERGTILFSALQNRFIQKLTIRTIDDLT